MPDDGLELAFQLGTDEARGGAHWRRSSAPRALKPLPKTGFG